MNKIVLLLSLLLLISCVKRDNPFDPAAENFDEHLHYQSNTILLTIDKSDPNNASVSLETIKLEKEIALLHLLFEDENIVVDEITVTSSIAGLQNLPLKNDNSVTIVSVNTPISGSVNLATISITSDTDLPENIKLLINEDNIENSTLAKDKSDKTITGINWLTSEKSSKREGE